MRYYYSGSVFNIRSKNEIPGLAVLAGSDGTAILSWSRQLSKEPFIGAGAEWVDAELSYRG
ncbi:MAG: hypothetical protein AB1714_01130 [Acidobacteriota bacterium]